MFKNKSKTTTIILTIVTILLIGTILYISTLLTTNEETTTSQVAPKKTKAASITYSKLIALNQTPIEPTQTEPNQEASALTPTPDSKNQVSAINGTQNQTESEQTPTPGVTDQNTPTPTETVLAYVNPTGSASEEATVTVLPTKVEDLPDAGFIYNGLIIFAAAMVLVFFSFLF